MLHNVKSLLISTLSFLTFLFLIYCVFLHYSIGDNPWIFYNADSVYLPYLYRDLFQKGGTISEWIFSPTPYFFPDMLIYFFIAFIVSHLKLAIILFATIQLALYYYFIVAIGSKIISNPNQISLFQISVLISLLLLANGYFKQETLDMAMTSQAHFGTALMFLLGTLLILKTFSSDNLSNFIFLFLVCLLTVFSDLVFLTQFIAPVILSLVIMLIIYPNPIFRFTCIKNIIAILTGSLLSYIIYQNQFFYLNIDIYTNPLKRLAFDQLLAGIKKIGLTFEIYYHTNSFVSILWITFFILSCLILTSVIFHHRKKNRHSESFLFVTILLFLSIVLGFFSLLFLDNNLMVDNYYKLRHSISYIIFPVFLGIPTILSRCGETITKWIPPVSLISIFAITVTAYITKANGQINHILNFYPKSIACLDSFVEKYHFQNGITDYYREGKSNNFLSKKNLNIVTLKHTPTQRLVPRFYFNTSHDYNKKNFYFILTNRSHQIDTEFYQNTTKENLIKQFGNPQFEFICPSWNKKQNTIYVYPNGIRSLINNREKSS